MFSKLWESFCFWLKPWEWESKEKLLPSHMSYRKSFLVFSKNVCMRIWKTFILCQKMNQIYHFLVSNCNRFSDSFVLVNMNHELWTNCDSCDIRPTFIIHCFCCNVCIFFSCSAGKVSLTEKKWFILSCYWWPGSVLSTGLTLWEKECQVARSWRLFRSWNLLSRFWYFHHREVFNKCLKLHYYIG